MGKSSRRENSKPLRTSNYILLHVFRSLQATTLQSLLIVTRSLTEPDLTLFSTFSHFYRKRLKFTLHHHRLQHLNPSKSTRSNTAASKIPGSTVAWSIHLPKSPKTYPCFIPPPGQIIDAKPYPPPPFPAAGTYPISHFQCEKSVAPKLSSIQTSTWGPIYDPAKTVSHPVPPDATFRKGHLSRSVIGLIRMPRPSICGSHDRLRGACLSFLGAIKSAMILLLNVQ